MTSRTLPLSSNQQAHCLDQGAGEPLVLIHGVGMQAAAWGPQIAAFAQQYRVIAVDMPGHGQSTRLPGEPGLTDYVAWMVEFISALQLGPVNLAGHSMGALIAAGVAIERPDLVRRLAVINGVHLRTDAARHAVVTRSDELATGRVDVETPLQRWFDEGTTEASLVEDVRSWLENVDVQGYADAYRAFARGDVTYAERWSEVGCPALALTGAEDANSTPAMALSMAALARNGKAVVIPHERHMVNLTAPAKVNAALAEWLGTTTN
ncbi:alpha/beta hydrolase [Stenotrophomonas sp. ZAC14D1_NAIMI4_6]|uniref:alpha/beta fold hydrolase n=1 Tax=Stenotrophomonas TaxID=40323 RepID=UPI0009A226AF|nr:MULTISPECIES: alpha/beta fold hydrolase [Stenotrophomonas]AWH37401.1 alpha/beta hydrolase [Stenotrophomonas sp. ZAC14D1_NAIMI4_6]AWH41590.1 alpha/beta hydrolase [Stenotrophomonas sp. ZAC14D1_NAIMI4_1]MDI9224901.1 alpha/beta fold hydrolase [Serratia bockelmannii]MDI9273565.1 alpha/beta fold hydrolase [Stenotrophomonas sp. PFBMAA-4]